MPALSVARPHAGALLLPAILLMLAEYLWLRWQGRDSYDWCETAVSAAILAGQLFARALTTLLLTPVLLWVYRHRLFDLHASDWRNAPILFVGIEFSYYWFHRCSHRVRWLWATHAVHHSSAHLNLSAALRLGWTNLLSGGWLFFLPLVWIGYAPAAVFGWLAAGLLYQFLIHTEAIGRLGTLEWILNTPSHHRVHHCLEADLLDRNFGSVLIVFDRLFGTFAAEPSDRRLRFGLAGAGNPAGQHNPVAVALGEWRRLFAELRRTQHPLQALRLALGAP